MYHYPVFERLAATRMPSSPQIQRTATQEQAKANLAIKLKTDLSVEPMNVMRVQSPSGVSTGLSHSNREPKKLVLLTEPDPLPYKQATSFLQPSTMSQRQQQTIYKAGCNKRLSFVDRNFQAPPNAKAPSNSQFQFILQYKSQSFAVAFDVQGDTTTTVFKRLLERLYNWELAQSSVMRSEIIQEIQSIQHFQTLERERNLSVDYYLSLPSRPLSVFKGYQQVVVVPFYGMISKGLQITLDDFLFYKCIGVGGFSRVYLVRKRDTGTFYALKIVDKKFILHNRKEVVIKNERDVMARVDSAFLSRLHFSFESECYLVFVMDYCQGGELFFHLRKLKRLNEDLAKFYFAQVCLAIDYLHQAGVVYRDVKPENILVDMDGYLQLSDFGLSKPGMSNDDVAFSFCGSPEYMAPEMLQKSGHTFLIDFYCLGALLYEFTTGLPPFYSRNVDQIYNSILSDEIKFPTNCKASNELRDLIRQLLNKDPDSRIGSNNGAKELLNHRWFKNFDLFALARKDMMPPYKPEPLAYNFDQQEFEKGDAEFQQRLKRNLAKEKSHPHFANLFPGFAYTRPQQIHENQKWMKCIVQTNMPCQPPSRLFSGKKQSASNLQQEAKPIDQGQQNSSSSMKERYLNLRMKNFKSESDLLRFIHVGGKGSQDTRQKKDDVDKNNATRNTKLQNSKQT